MHNRDISRRETRTALDLCSRLTLRYQLVGASIIFKQSGPELVKTKFVPTKTACDPTFLHYKFCSNFNAGRVMTQNHAPIIIPTANKLVTLIILIRTAIYFEQMLQPLCLPSAYKDIKNTALQWVVFWFFVKFNKFLINMWWEMKIIELHRINVTITQTTKCWQCEYKSFHILCK